MQLLYDMYGICTRQDALPVISVHLLKSQLKSRNL